MLTNKKKFILYSSILLCIKITTIETLTSNIKTIDKEDQFLAIIDQKEPTIVMGFMDNCPHCKHIAPVFEKLSQKHKKISFVKANGIKINMHEHVKHESKNKGDFIIPGYPSFIFIKNKRIYSVLIGGDQKSLTDAVKEFEKHEKKCK